MNFRTNETTMNMATPSTISGITNEGSIVTYPWASA
jgi:hypothetical protein